ncbi:MAG: ABC transporter permease [Acidimicrobiales bacterium]
MTGPVLVLSPGRHVWRDLRATKRVLPPLAVVVGALVVWQLAVVGFDIEESLLPKPSTIAATFVDEFSVLIDAARFTLRSVVGGLVLGAAAGFLVAVATARFSFVTEASVPLAAAINSAPIVALAPITGQWFGVLEATSKMAVVAAVVFFPVMINVTRGLTTVDPSQLELLRSYAASGRQVVVRARLPNALPYLFSGLKVASSLSVIAAIVSEYFGGPRDALGVYITQQTALSHNAEAWGAIVVSCALGLALFGLVTLVERVVMPWHVSFRHER